MSVFSHSLHHIILLRYGKLNQINGNLRSPITVPNPLFIVLGYQLNILSSVTSDIVNHRKRVPQGFLMSDSEIKSGIEVEKNSGKKILSSSYLLSIKQHELETQKKTLTKSAFKTILASITRKIECLN